MNLLHVFVFGFAGVNHQVRN